LVGGHSGTLGREPPLTYFGSRLTVCLVTDSRHCFKSGHCQIQIRPLNLAQSMRKKTWVFLRALFSPAYGDRGRRLRRSNREESDGLV
jgi:hypothetical protein